MCGEQLFPCSRHAPSVGSSPRVRGTATGPWNRFRLTRFIPACAGNSRWRDIDNESRSVHPRVCGEQDHEQLRYVQGDGSSPRVRGTVFLISVSHEVCRFIPACAGNRPIFVLLWVFSSVHPRVCGEQQVRTVSGNEKGGSSPRVRGTAGRALNSASARRFIPACAGNSRLPAPVFARIAVHPRVCGEQVDQRVGRVPQCGSSPRVRGTVQLFRQPVDPGRFIPACAGNRRECGMSGSRFAVHPRVCGEQSCFHMPKCSPIGSSPRVRGTVLHFPKVDYIVRFIPACAGNRLSTSHCFAMSLLGLENLPIASRCTQPIS